MSAAAGDDERLVKSSERVRDLGEVFTPSRTVDEMLDMLPESMWAIHPAPNFLEPACGDGNFLVAILSRKLESVALARSNGTLPAGESDDAILFHALEALASIYAVDISADNIIGGTPGHELGARTRLLNVLMRWHADTFGRRLNDDTDILRSAKWIVEHNIIVGNMLPVDADGRPTGRDAIPLIEYAFQPETLAVILRRTTLGDVIEAAQGEVAVEMKLFGPPEPELVWTGPGVRLFEAERVEAPGLIGPARNGVVRQ